MLPQVERDEALSDPVKLGALRLATGGDAEAAHRILFTVELSVTAPKNSGGKKAANSKISELSSFAKCKGQWLYSGGVVNPAPGAWELLTFDFCLSTSIPVLTTSTYVVAWPQGDQFLGGDL